MDLWSRYRHTLLFSRKLPLLVSSKNGCPSEGIPEPFLHHGLATLSLSDLQSWSRDDSDADNRFDLSAINYNDVPLLTVYSRLSFEKTLTSSDLCFGSVQLGSQIRFIFSEERTLKCLLCFGRKFSNNREVLGKEPRDYFSGHPKVVIIFLVTIIIII